VKSSKWWIKKFQVDSNQPSQPTDVRHEQQWWPHIPMEWTITPQGQASYQSAPSDKQSDKYIFKPSINTVSSYHFADMKGKSLHQTEKVSQKVEAQDHKNIFLLFSCMCIKKACKINLL
jgi:hypothetical protein